MVVIHDDIPRGRKSCCKCFETLFLLKLLSNYLEFTKIVLSDLYKVFIKEEMERNDIKKLVTCCYYIACIVQQEFLLAHKYNPSDVHFLVALLSLFG